MASEADLRLPTPPGLAEKIRRQGPSEGERRTVTVLFADAVGSTPLAEKLGEEAMYGLMREALTRMGEAVHHYEGHVAAFTGDGLMALFGAPIAHEDSARRGVAAALRMQESLAGLGAEVQGRHGVPCRFRVGLNTGPVVVGTVTEDLRMDFTAIGDTVNLAARMEQAAEPGAVLISEETHRTVADFFDAEPLGELAVKGKAAPVPGWRVVGARPVRTRFQAAATRGLSPLVGRDRELARLARFGEHALAGDGRVLFLSGAAGIGKSRLILEWRHRLERVRWLEGRCVSYGRSSPYLPVVDVVKAAFGVAEGDDEGRIITRVDERVAGWDAQAQKRVPYLKFLLSVDPGDEAVAGMDPPERRAGIFEALAALLVEETRAGPLVVTVEDLHWADRMSLEALGSLTSMIPTVPVLLLLTHRPDYVPPAGQGEVMTLAYLDEDESLALIRGVLGVESLAPEIHRLITAKAEGNPFYIEEVAKALVEGGVVERVDGDYRLRPGVGEVEVPGTIQEVILSRIDRLAREAKEAMQLASVVGREFTARVLDRISYLEAQLSDVLGDLSALEFIRQTSRFPELAFMFNHALTHDVAYATLLADRRRALHRLVGAAIEELYADRLGEHYETLAHHYSEGRDWPKALEYLEKAGDKAAAAYANPDAVGFYAAALSLCDTLGEEQVPRSLSLAAKRGFVNLVMGDLPACIADFDLMLAAARHLGDRSLEGTALGYRGFMEAVSAEFEAAEETLKAAWGVVAEGFEEIRPLVALASMWLFTTSNRVSDAVPLLISPQEAAALPDPFTAGMWNWALGLFDYWRGRPAAALLTLGAMPESAAKMVSNRTFNWWVQGLVLGAMGEYQSALQILHETLAACERVGDALVRPRVLNTIGWIYGELEDHERARHWNQACVDFILSLPAFPEADVEMHARVNLGDNLMALGRPLEAEEQFRQAERRATSPRAADRWMAWRYSEHLFHSYGELWLARGDVERSLRYADRCLELAVKNTSPKNMIKGRRLRGQVLGARGSPEDAARELAAAIEVAAEVGNPPQLWKTHTAIGDLRRDQGRAEESMQSYDEALTLIETTAAGLRDDGLREAFLASPAVGNVRRAAGGLR